MPTTWTSLNGLMTSASSTTSTLTYCNETWSSWSASSTTTLTVNWSQTYPSGLERLWNRPSVRTHGATPSRPARTGSPSPARAKARELLVGFLDPLQKAQYDETGKFDIVGSDGTLYRIGPGTNGNVEWIDPANGNVKGRLCAHPRAYDSENRRIPEPDLHLGQLLALTTDERAWLEVANLHRGEWPPIRTARRIELPVNQLAA